MLKTANPASWKRKSEVMHPTVASQWSDTRHALHTHTEIICSPQCKHICHWSCEEKRQKSLLSHHITSVFCLVLCFSVHSVNRCHAQHHLCLNSLLLCSFTHPLFSISFLTLVIPVPLSLCPIFALSLALCITFSSILQREEGKHYNP